MSKSRHTAGLNGLLPEYLRNGSKESLLIQARLSGDPSHTHDCSGCGNPTKCEPIQEKMIQAALEKGDLSEMWRLA